MHMHGHKLLVVIALLLGVGAASLRDANRGAVRDMDHVIVQRQNDTCSDGQPGTGSGSTQCDTNDGQPGTGSGTVSVLERDVFQRQNDTGSDGQPGTGSGSAQNDTGAGQPGTGSG
ncbi:hypothetical protein B0H10DRAFT_2198156 [Mycena sp. CBHHK59/15]|nr:hypothetical protein B0H10DRAFT_2198156 [Mycena sp. CBHHK59/15]